MRRAALVAALTCGLMSACGGDAALAPATPSALSSANGAANSEPAATGDDNAPHGDSDPTAESKQEPDPISVTASTAKLLEDFSERPMFPSNNWWNQDISNAPVDSQSSAFIDFIGPDRRLHPDFGPPPYGIPYVGVGGSEPRVPVAFVDYGAESDTGYRGLDGYPIPAAAKTQRNFIEGGEAGGGTDGDRHMLIVDRDRWVLYETWATRWNASRRRWEAGSGAVFDLSSNARRPEGWTSADAAGLAILPGLVRYDEARRGRINHALRVTVRATNGYVWPASHSAGSRGGALPMGARLRLKASKDFSGYPAHIRAMFRAMQTYGLIVADNGSDMFITGTMDARWNNGELNPAFRALAASDFEVIRLGWR
ncbi:MAG TPA: hypothetical protein VM115_05575 [Vicinamibacterales bacterium]|nr:hypothetical protein [Vicinamibacterales bacterium]